MNPSPAPSFKHDHATLARDLLALGLCAKDRVMVHSSFSAIGSVAGGPEAVILALMNVVEKEGMIAMPTFNHGRPFFLDKSAAYDPKTTESESGVITSVFFKMPGVFRSLNPTHPIAAWGLGAEELVRGHELTLTMGPDSPLGKLHASGAKVLHLGTTHEATTARHLAETMHDAGCLRSAPDLFPASLGSRGTVLLPTWRYREAPCPLLDDVTLLSERLAPLERSGVVGDAKARLCDMTVVVATALSLLQRGAVTETGRKHPPCKRCTIGPSARAEGDWD